MTGGEALLLLVPYFPDFQSHLIASRFHVSAILWQYIHISRMSDSIGSRIPFFALEV